MSGHVTLCDLAVWHYAQEGDTYAFPLGTNNPWRTEVLPEIRLLDWQYKGTLPKGMPVTELREEKGDRVTCVLAGARVYTARWAIGSSSAAT